MNELKLEVQQVQEEAPFVNGVSTPSVRITYKLGRFGPFIETLPKDGFTMQAFEAKIAPLRAQLGALG